MQVIPLQSNMISDGTCFLCKEVSASNPTADALASDTLPGSEVLISYPSPLLLIRKHSLGRFHISFARPDAVQFEGDLKVHLVGRFSFGGNERGKKGQEYILAAGCDFSEWTA